MFRIGFASAIACFVLTGIFLTGFPQTRLAADESILASYHRNFIRASLAGKTGILLDAATDERAGEFIGELYEIALQYALSMGQLLRDDPEMVSMVAVAARGAGIAGNTDSIESLWELFGIFLDSHTRVEILGALGSLGRENRQVVAKLNQFLDEKNSAVRAGLTIDTAFPVLQACIAALGLLEDESSFPFLFAAMTAGHPQGIIQETLRAIDSIQGNHTAFLIDVIRNNPFPEKAVAFRLGAYNERLAMAERAEITRTALEVSLDADDPVANSLRYDAVTFLTRYRWSPAAPLALRNFYRVQTNYLDGTAPRARLLEAIASLGVMDSTEAAQSLTLQLGLINSRTERTGEFEEDIVLAIINALGELGDRVAFDHLLYISFLNYPDRVQASAREALNRLRW